MNDEEFINKIKKLNEQRLAKHKEIQISSQNIDRLRDELERERKKFHDAFDSIAQIDADILKFILENNFDKAKEQAK